MACSCCSIFNSIRGACELLQMLWHGHIPEVTHPISARPDLSPEVAAAVIATDGLECATQPDRV